MSEDEDELQISLQFDLQTVAYWMRENRLSLNASKTKFMMLGSKPHLARAKQFTLSVNGEIIQVVNNFKYLGMTLDNHLQFDTHIDKVVDKTTTK